MAELRTPADVATRHTVSFLRAHAPRGRLLEVGCGDGRVAQALFDDGFDVTGIDQDADAVAAANTLGVPAHCATWPDFRGGPYDAIAFTRSLHHILPLSKAVRQAHALLRPAGVLLIEDFAYADADAVTIAWFRQTLRSDDVRSLLRPVPGTLVTSLLAADGAKNEHPQTIWHREHDHDLHTWPAIVAAAAEHFVVREQPPAAYLFRYLIPVVEESASGAALVRRIRQQEMDLAGQGEIMLIGRRLVGMRS